MSKRKYTKSKPLLVGTDCSGIEAPIQVLKQLKIPHRHVFSSEIDKYCVKSILANYSPEIIYGDIRDRDNSSLPDIDLYVCGFPCQPFSTAGSRKGLEDERGNIFFSCLDVIKKKQPKYFILENVKGLLSNDGGNTWKIILSHLNTLSKYGYTVKWSVLNTRDYGIPQNRPRVYIVGCKSPNFEWPEKMEMDDIMDYVDYEDTEQFTITKSKNRVDFLNNLNSNHVFIDMTFSKEGRKAKSAEHYCCCITTCLDQLWNCVMGRYANVKELLMLQGFPTDFNVVVSKTQIVKQIGNSMSVNVLKEIMKNLLLL